MLSYPKVLISLFVLLALTLSSCKNSDNFTKDSTLDADQVIEGVQDGVIQDETEKCPDCRNYPVISTYEFTNAEVISEFLHCRICGTKGDGIQRTYIFHTQCTNNCGYEITSDTEVQYGIQCPVDGNVWMTYLKYSPDEIYEPNI